MRIDASIICQDARTRNDGAIDLIGIGVDAFTVNAFPVSFSLPLFVRVVGEGPATADLLVQTHDANGDLQSETLQPLALGTRPAGLPERCPVRGMIGFRLNWTVNEPDAYTVSVSLAGTDPVETHVIFIRQG
jgi:hypothetical protein